MRFSAIILLMVLALSMTAGQTYTEMGLMSGSGLVLTPTNIVSPTAEFRVNVGRIGKGDESDRGMNVATINMGFSPIIEAYARFTSEQSGAAQSLGTIGFGGKIMVPIQLPVVKVVSFWGESTMSEMNDLGVLFSPRTTRFAVLNTPVWSDVFRPTILVGGMKYNGEPAHLMAGGSLVISPSKVTQIGMEYVHSYTRAGSQHATLTGIFRVFSNVCLQAGPGYASSDLHSGLVWTIGISVGTADVDFQPAPVKSGDEYILPSIEEILNAPVKEPGKPSEKQDQKEDDQ